MQTFVSTQRQKAAAWKATTGSLPDAARAAAPYVDKDGSAGEKPLPFCLPADLADLNLLPGIRERALALFRELEIPWHAGIDDGPSNHLLSSQVQCVNALTSMIDDPQRIKAAFGGVVDISDVLEIEPGRFLTFEYIGPEDYLGEARNGSRTRGAHCTSVDAAFRYRTSSGGTELALVEWKYTESYLRPRVSSPGREQERTRRYRDLYEAGDGPIAPLVSFAAMLDEPFYQLMRQQLMAHELERRQVLDVERVRVLHVLDPANEAFQVSLITDEIREFGDSVDDAWRKMLRRPDRFIHVDPAVFLDAAITSPEYVARYG